jgi:hypothetical protein
MTTITPSCPSTFLIERGPAVNSVKPLDGAALICEMEIKR